MTFTFGSDAFGSHLLSRTILASVALTVAAPVAAQDRAEPGPYGVVRAGAQFDSDLKFPKQGKAPAAKPGPTGTPKPTAARPAAPLVPPGFPRNVDGKPGFTGELGAGYDFGGFRVESTVGYNTAKIDASQLGNATTVGDGRTKSLTFDLAGYVDFNKDGLLKPFIGGGIGASRVDLDVSRLARPTTPATPAARRAGTTFDQRDWGFRWHLDAGVGYDIGPKTTVELAGRYTQTSSLAFKASTVEVTGTGPSATATTVANTFKPKMSSTSLMVGLRQKF